MQAQVDAMASPIYTSVLADAYKCNFEIINRFLARVVQGGGTF